MTNTLKKGGCLEKNFLSHLNFFADVYQLFFNSHITNVNINICIVFQRKHYTYKKIMNGKNDIYKREGVVWSNEKGMRGLSYPQILCDLCIGTCFFSFPACFNCTWFRVQ